MKTAAEVIINKDVVVWEKHSARCDLHGGDEVYDYKLNRVDVIILSTLEISGGYITDFVLYKGNSI